MLTQLRLLVVRANSYKLSKDHFSNILNEPAGKVAGAILKYAAPRVIYAWNHPEVPEQQVLDDVVQVFHHPAARNRQNEVHRSMFEIVEQWSRSYRGEDLNSALSSQSVRAGRNHKAEAMPAQGFQAYTQAMNQGTSALFGQRGMDEPSSGGYPGYIPQREAQYEPPSASQREDFGARREEYEAPSGPPPGHRPPPASFQPNDPYAYPSAYQQGYEPQSGGPERPQGYVSYGQPPQQQPYDQESYGEERYGQEPYGRPPPPSGPYGQQGWGNQNPNQYGQGGYGYDQRPPY